MDLNPSTLVHGLQTSLYDFLCMLDIHFTLISNSIPIPPGLVQANSIPIPELDLELARNSNSGAELTPALMWMSSHNHVGSVCCGV